MSNLITRSITKNVDINAPIEKVFNFLVNPLNWPGYAVVNLKSVSKGSDGWFNMTTKFGQGQIKMLAEKTKGILDHTWKDPQATWTVFARVVPNGQGSTFMMTFFQPPIMTNEIFDEAMKDMDVEMAKLKEILEER